MTDQQAPSRNLDVDAVLARYRNRLAVAEERAIIAEAGLEAAERECADLRLQVITLQEHAAEE